MNLRKDHGGSAVLSTAAWVNYSENESDVETTGDKGSLGHRIDEERSETRKAVWVAWTWVLERRG